LVVHKSSSLPRGFSARNNDLIKKGIRCCYFDFNYVQRFDFFERIYRDIT